MDVNLAGRLTRLGAQIIDGLIFMIPYGCLLILARLLEAPAIMGLAFLVMLGIAVVQIILLTTSGQTIGKRLLSIKIVKIDTGENGGFVPNVLLRLLVNGLIGIIPFYALVDILFIFRNDRRCIHDLIAGTRVVEA